MPPCPISRHRQFPGRGPPSSPSPAAARKHSARPLRVRGGPPCRPAQRRRGRIPPAPPPVHPVPQLWRHPWRRLAAARSNPSRNDPSARLFPGRDKTAPNPALQLHPTAVKLQRIPPGGPLPCTPRPRQLLGFLRPLTPVRGPTAGSKGRHPNLFSKMGRPSFPRRPVWAAPAKVSAAVSMGQEHTKPPFPHSLPSAAERPRPAQQERAKAPFLRSLPPAAGRPRPARQERAEPSLPHSLLSVVERRRPAQQERARPPRPCSLPSVAGRHRPAQQERARPPRLCSLPSVAGRHRPARQERAEPPHPHSLPSAAERPRPARQERAEPPLPHSLPSAAERHRPAQQEHANAPFLPSLPSVAEGPRPVWQENPSQSPAQARGQSASNPIPIRRP